MVRNPLFYGCLYGRPFLILAPQGSRREKRILRMPMVGVQANADRHNRPVAYQPASPV
jgi:hypothetical protein